MALKRHTGYCASRNDMADCIENLGFTERIIPIVMIVDIGVLARGAAAVRQLGILSSCPTTSCERQDVIDRAILERMDLVLADSASRVGVEQLAAQLVWEEARVGLRAAQDLLHLLLEAVPPHPGGRFLGW